MSHRMIAGLIVAGMLLIGVGSGAAQTPVPTPTADGCDAIPDYLAQLDTVSAAMRQSWTEAFPGVTYLRDMTDAESDAWFASLSPDGFRALARIMDAQADLREAITPPPIAVYYHEQQILGVRVLANAIRDAAELGLLVAGLAYSDQMDAIETARDDYGQQAVAVCPAFQLVIDWEHGRQSATPVASPVS